MKSSHFSSTTELTSQETWLSLNHIQPFSWIQNLFTLTEYVTLLHAQTLNSLKYQTKADISVTFTCQSELSAQVDYYEQFIHSNQTIPTRADSWHDLFNGLVWLQFPKTKQILNRWHVEDIQEYGASPRNKRRNQITHFDECGVILVCDDEAVLRSLEDHEFKSAMFHQRHRWGVDIHPLIFGHANYEMMMKPYLGLTGKWLAIPPCANFADLAPNEQLAHVDDTLAERLNDEKGFTNECSMSPLPLLGVPGWYPHNTEAAFYDNRDYFRPKSTKLSQQSKYKP